MTAEYTPDEITYDFTRHPKQWPFIIDDRRFLVWQGGRGSTKTSSACFHLMRMIEEPKWFGARGIIAAPISKQLKQGPLQSFDEWFEPTGMILKSVNGNEPRREMINGWMIYGYNVGPHGEGAEAWRGMQNAWAWLDEAAQMPEKAFFLANATLRQQRPDRTHYPFQTILTTTPRGQNWLYKRFLDPQAKNYTDKELGLYVSTTRESVKCGILPPNYIEEMGYTPGTMMYRQEILGEVVSWAGLVFEFDAERHVSMGDYDRSTKTYHWPEFTAVYGGIDIGTSDPTALILVAIDKLNRVWVIKEYYERRARFDEWIDIAARWNKDYGVRKWFVDSDITVKLCQRGGLNAHAPYKAKDAALVSINYLNQKMHDDAFFIAPECLALRTELETYEYRDEMTGGEVTFLQKVKPNQLDHAIDALRYAVLPLTASQAQAQYGQSVRFAYA